MHQGSLFERYEELRKYVGWTEVDQRCSLALGARLESTFEAVVTDFYQEIDRHPATRQLLTGGHAQVERLKLALLAWLHDLCFGHYDEAYVQRRWNVGLRHAELGLDQVYCNMAMARVRNGLLAALVRGWEGEKEDLLSAAVALNKLLDLDLAIIEDAYQTERLARQQKIERLAGLGQIAGGIAHELRNPLHVLKTSVYFLQNSPDSSAEKRSEHLSRIERHVDLADGVITALSNFARMPAPHRDPFSLGDCVGVVLDQTGLPETIEVVVADLDSLPPVAADAAQLQIVFSNLLRNAAEAMSWTGRVTISGRTDQAFSEVDVTDTGPGISPEQLPHLMEPFYTTKPRGLGLGLAICRSIMQSNQGELRVTSALGSGSTFTVRLPAAPTAAPAADDPYNESSSRRETLPHEPSRTSE